MGWDASEFESRDSRLEPVAGTQGRRQGLGHSSCCRREEGLDIF